MALSQLTTDTDKLTDTSNSLEAFAFLSMVLGVLGGLVVAVQTTEECSIDTILGRLYEDCSTGRPYVGLGIGIAVAAVLNGLLFLGVARSMRVLARYVSWRVTQPGNVPGAVSSATVPRAPSPTRPSQDVSSSTTNLVAPAPPIQRVTPEAAGFYLDPYIDIDALAPDSLLPMRMWDGTQWTRTTMKKPRDDR